MAFDPRKFAETTVGSRRARLVQILGLPLPGGQTALFQIGNDTFVSPYFADGTVNGPGGSATNNDLVNIPRHVTVHAWIVRPKGSLHASEQAAEQERSKLPAGARVVELTGVDAVESPDT